MGQEHRIKIALEGVYDGIKESVEFLSLSQDEIKLRMTFLSHADKAISFNDYGVILTTGTKGVYTYYNSDRVFLKINLNNSPDFINKNEFIEWFKEKYLEGFQNLNT